MVLVIMAGENRAQYGIIEHEYCEIRVPLSMGADARHNLTYFPTNCRKFKPENWHKRS